MTALAIFLFVVAAWSFYCVARPRTAWRVTEGWKYRDAQDVEPSDAYLSLQSVGAAIGGIAAVAIGIALLVIPTGAEREREREQEQQAEREACEPARQRFRDTVRFEDAEVANRDDVTALASSLDVTADIESLLSGAAIPGGEPPQRDTVTVRRGDDFLFLMSDVYVSEC
ncbi:MAG: hypothetical protein M3517_01265 [Actinomycetota bacterium]|nr:hypothetical protein [Actinomycetota bacterium]